MYKSYIYFPPIKHKNIYNLSEENKKKYLGALIGIGLTDEEIKMPPTEVYKTQNNSKIYLGNYKDAVLKCYREELNISVIINCAYGFAPDPASTCFEKSDIVCLNNKEEYDKFKLPEGLITLRLKAFDDDYQELDTHFLYVIQFINKCLEDNRNILIHCHRGISRSATIVIAYLINYEPIKKVNVVLDELKSKRHIVNPNKNFLKQLEKFRHSLLYSEDPDSPVVVLSEKEMALVCYDDLYTKRLTSYVRSIIMRTFLRVLWFLI